MLVAVLRSGRCLRVIRRIGSDLRRIPVAGDDNFVMASIPPNAVRVRQVGARSLDDAERSIHAISFAAIYGQHTELLNRDGHLVARAIQGDSPALMRDV